MTNERAGHPRASLRAGWLAARNAIVPNRHGHGWLPFVPLVFLLPIVSHYFTPDVMAVAADFQATDSGAIAVVDSSVKQIEPVSEAGFARLVEVAEADEVQPDTLEAMAYDGRLSFYAIPLFLVLYFLSFRLDGYWLLSFASLIGIAGYLLQLYDPLAIIYMCYAAALLGLCSLSLAIRLAALGLLYLMATVVELYVRLGAFPASAVFLQNAGYAFEGFFSSLTFGLPMTVFVFAHFHQVGRRKDRQLRLSRQETGRMAALAERERIARDLHDLLGHTLSMVALKAELASELLSRDASRSRREIDQVADIARDALAQVRSAVDGMRGAALQAELAAARELLDAVGVVLTIRIDALTMTAELESTLAMVLREAVTNIQRHAGARHAHVSLAAEGDCVRLQVDDDGHGRSVRAGNGLNGMRERLRLVGGTLELAALQPRGIRVVAMVPAAQGLA